LLILLHLVWLKNYVVSKNKTPPVAPQYFYGNFGMYEPILIILSLLHSAVNCGRNYYITCHLISNLLPHYLAEFECWTVHRVRKKRAYSIMCVTLTDLQIFSQFLL